MTTKTTNNEADGNETIDINDDYHCCHNQLNDDRSVTFVYSIDGSKVAFHACSYHQNKFRSDTLPNQLHVTQWKEKPYDPNSYMLVIGKQKEGATQRFVKLMISFYTDEKWERRCRRCNTSVCNIQELEETCDFPSRTLYRLEFQHTADCISTPKQ